MVWPSEPTTCLWHHTAWLCSPEETWGLTGAKGILGFLRSLQLGSKVRVLSCAKQLGGQRHGRGKCHGHALRLGALGICSMF